MKRLAILAVLTLVACTPDLTGVNIRAVHTPIPSGLVLPSPSPLPVVIAARTPVPSPSPSILPSASPTVGPVATPTAPPATTAPSTPVPSTVLGISKGAQAPDTWVTGPSLHRPRSGLLAAAVNGTLYAVEGENRASLEYLADGTDYWVPIEAGDPGTGQIIPIGRRLAALGFDATRLVGAGGDDSSVLDEVFSYDKDGAGLAGRLASPVMAAAAGLVGDTLAIAGGLDANRAVRGDVQTLNVQSQETGSGAAMPLAVAGAAYAVLNGKLYVLGGYTLDAAGSPVPQTAVQVYDVAANTWQRDGDGKPNSPPGLTNARHSAAAAVLNGKLYLMGGAGTGGGLLNQASVYDPITNTWSNLALMPTPRALHGLAAFGGKLWAIGGRGVNGAALTSVEGYQP